MEKDTKFELMDWLSTISGVIFLAIRTTDVSPLLFIIGSAFCILEGAVDLFLYFRKEKEKRRVIRLLYSVALILISLQGVYILYAKAT